MTYSRNLHVILLGLLVSLLALYFIITQINGELFFEALQTADYRYIVPCVVLLLLGLVTRALRWQVLLGKSLPLYRTFSIMNVAYLVNGVLPLRIGEVARVYLAARAEESVPIPKTTGTIIVERLTDLLAIVVMVLLALSLGPVPYELRIASGFAAVFAIVGFLILIVLAARRHWTERFFGFLFGRLPIIRRFGVLEEWLGQFLDGLDPLTQPYALTQVLFWTTISWALSTMAGYMLMFAFFEQASLAGTMLYIAAAAFAIALPAVPGNIGTYEASILLALTAVGYEQSSIAVAFAVMVHAVNVVVHAATGVVGFIQEGISLGQLSEGVQGIQTQGNRVG